MSEYDDLRDCRDGCKLCGAKPNPDGLTITCAPGCPQIYSYGQSPEERQRWVDDAKAYERLTEGDVIDGLRRSMSAAVDLLRFNSTDEASETLKSALRWSAERGRRP